MTTPVKSPDATSLDELAAVTKAYGKYSGRAGLAVTLAGVWLAGAGWVLGNAPRAGELLFALGPTLWLWLATRARRYYERHGTVVPVDESAPLPMRQIGHLVVFASSVAGIMRQFQGPRRGYELLGVALFVAVPPLAMRFARSIAQLWGAAVMSLSAAIAQGVSVPSRWDDRLLVGALILVVGGIADHWHYRRVVRRLAASRTRG